MGIAIVDLAMVGVHETKETGQYINGQPLRSLDGSEVSAPSASD